MIDRNELEKLQNLSKITLSPAEVESFTNKLNSILTMISAITHIDCNNIEPLTSVKTGNQRTREDEVKNNDIEGNAGYEQIFSNIPDYKQETAQKLKYFIVPRMVE